MAVVPVREGDILAGKYRVDRVLGVGGMGVVVAAHHLQLDERVAIKFLLPETLGNPEAVGRFVREARAAVKIKSEHVARVIDVGTLDDGAPYMVMEYLDGMDLGDWITHHGPPPLELAVEFILQACEAVAEAHRLGIVHRDLKPANLFCVRCSDGRWTIKLLDFGISKMTGLQNGGPDMRMTATAAVIGSPLYMSPEQLKSARDVDARTDIWSLGVILHQVLMGEVPFVASSFPELCIKIVNQPVPRLRDTRPDLPPGIEKVIETCLEKDPARRYPSVRDLAISLSPFASKRAQVLIEQIAGSVPYLGASGARTVSLSAAEGQVTAERTASSWGQTAGLAEKGRTKPMLWGVAGLALLGGGVAFAMLRLGNAPQTDRVPPPRAEPSFVASSAVDAVRAEGAAASSARALEAPSPSAIAPSTAPSLADTFPGTAAPAVSTKTPGKSRPSSLVLLGAPAPSAAAKSRPTAPTSTHPSPRSDPTADNVYDDRR